MKALNHSGGWSIMGSLKEAAYLCNKSVSLETRTELQVDALSVSCREEAQRPSPGAQGKPVLQGEIKGSHLGAQGLSCDGDTWEVFEVMNPLP